MFSVPVFKGNQGRAPTAADGLTLDDAEVPENGEYESALARGVQPCLYVRAGIVADGASWLPMSDSGRRITRDAVAALVLARLPARPVTTPDNTRTRTGGLDDKHNRRVEPDQLGEEPGSHPTRMGALADHHSQDDQHRLRHSHLGRRVTPSHPRRLQLTRQPPELT